MARMPASKRDEFLGDVLSARAAAATGVTPKTTTERQKYWTHWCDLAASTKIDPFLPQGGIDPIERDIIASAFIARVRRGCFGRRRQVMVGTVSDALAAVSKTIQLAGQPSQLYRGENRYQLYIERIVEGYRRADPPSIPQLAVPVTVPVHAYTHSLKEEATPLKKDVDYLMVMAFYFLLRVGEYTQPKTAVINGQRVPATRTKQFSVDNVGFFKDGKLVPRTSPLQTLLECDLCTLKISNQKNGRMGETITQHSSGTDVCPVQAVARIVNHILANGGTGDTLLCHYYDDDEWKSVTSPIMVQAVREAAKQLELSKQGIDLDLIGAHSLRAGGAMAIKLHGYSDTTIMKMGRWTSLTFLQYIHNQIAHLSKDISKKYPLSSRL